MAVMAETLCGFLVMTGIRGPASIIERCSSPRTTAPSALLEEAWREYQKPVTRGHGPDYYEAKLQSLLRRTVG